MKSQIKLRFYSTKSFYIIVLLIIILGYAIVTGIGIYSKSKLHSKYSNEYSALVNQYGDYKITFTLDDKSFESNGIVNEVVLPAIKNAPIVAKCTPLKQAQQQFESTIQQLKVLQVYKGKKSLKGKTINYMMPIDFDHELNVFCRSFVNYMTVGNDYLVFIYPYGYTESNTSGYSYKDTYMATDYGFLAYFNITNITDFEANNVLVSNGVTPYNYARNNEVFASSENALDQFYSLKREIVQQYIK